MWCHDLVESSYIYIRLGIHTRVQICLARQYRDSRFFQYPELGQGSNCHISQRFFPSWWADRTPQISSWVITTHCWLHSNISQILLLCNTWRYYNKFDYEIIGGTLPVCLNTTLRVNRARIKIYCVLCSKTYNTLHSCHNFPAGSRQATRGARICETSLLDSDDVQDDVTMPVSLRRIVNLIW